MVSASSPASTIGPSGTGRAEAFLNRYNRANKRKQHWRTLYADTYKFALPQRETFNSYSEGQSKIDHIFDSTAMDCAGKFASKLQNGITPPFKKWVDLKPGTSVVNKKAANEQLAVIRDTMFEVLFETNFDTQVTEHHLDLAVGTGALLVQEGRGGMDIIFEAVPLSQLVFEQGPFGKPETVFREFKVTYRNLPTMWPKASMSTEMTRRAKENPDAEITLVEGTLQRFNMTGDTLSWDYEYMVVAKTDKHVVFQDVFEVSPWIITRWMLIPGEIYGRGPLLTALPDIKTLNATVELILRNAALAVAGAYTVAHDGVMNLDNMMIGPATFIPVLYNSGPNGKVIEALPRTGDFDIAQIIIKDLQEKVQRAMFVQPIGGLDQPVRSATEISYRQAELAENIGSAFGRIQHEFVKPLVRRILYLLDKKGIIEVDKDVLKDGKIIQARVMSPLAEAQMMEDVLKHDRWLEMMQLRIGPQALAQRVKLEELPAWTAEKMGIDETLLRSDEEQQEFNMNVAGAMAATGGAPNAEQAAPAAA